MLCGKRHLLVNYMNIIHVGWTGNISLTKLIDHGLRDTVHTQSTANVSTLHMWEKISDS